MDWLPWTCRSQRKWLIGQTSEQSNHHKLLPSQMIWSVEELETIVGIQPRTLHHWLGVLRNNGHFACLTHNGPEHLQMLLNIHECLAIYNYTDYIRMQIHTLTHAHISQIIIDFDMRACGLKYKLTPYEHQHDGCGYTKGCKGSNQCNINVTREQEWSLLNKTCFPTWLFRSDMFAHIKT